MSFPKVFVSIFLLLTYTVGLAHEVIPHSHYNLVGHSHGNNKQAPDQHPADHQHHQENCENDHFTHGDHCDEDLLEYVVCLVSEKGHPATCNARFLYVPNLAHVKVKITEDQTFPSTAAFLSALVERYYPPAWHELQPELPLDYSPPLLAAAPLRGPPVVSC